MFYCKFWINIWITPECTSGNMWFHNLLVILLVIIILTDHIAYSMHSDGSHYGGQDICIGLQYDRAALMRIRDTGNITFLDLDVPPDCRRNNKRTNKRKRGKKGGVRSRVRHRRFKPPPANHHVEQCTITKETNG